MTKRVSPFRFSVEPPRQLAWTFPDRVTFDRAPVLVIRSRRVTCPAPRACPACSPGLSLVVSDLAVRGLW